MLGVAAGDRPAPLFIIPASPSLGPRRRFKDGFNHRVADLGRLSEPRLEEALRHLEPLHPRLEVPERHALGPPPRGKCELEVVGPERVVLDGGAQRVVQPLRVAEQVLGHAQPQAEQRRRADHVVVGHDAQRAPAVDHGEQAQVVVGQRLALLGLLPQAEAVEQAVLQQRRRRPLGRLVLLAENLLLGRVHAPPQLVVLALEHQLVQLRRAARVLRDLLARLRVQDRQPRVHVPVLRVDAQRQVDLCVLDPAHVPRPLPRELLHRVPRLAHRQERHVRHRLRVRRDAVVLARRQVHVLGVEAPEDSLDPGERLVRRAVLDEDLRACW